MKKSLVSALTLAALVAGGTADAQPMGVGLGTPVGPPGILISPQPSQPGNVASIGGSFGANGGAGIGPGMRSGVGPPTDGLDSNPYAEAPPSVRGVLGGRAHRSPRSGTAN
jgi:hypothetical protein